MEVKDMVSITQFTTVVVVLEYNTKLIYYQRGR